MKTPKPKSMLLQILVPILCIVVIWIAMSVGTTQYVLWVQRSSQRVNVENVSSVRAAEALQIAVWRLTSKFPTDSRLMPAFRDSWKEADTQIADAHQKLKDSAYFEAEQPPLAKMEVVLSGFRESYARLAEREFNANDSSSEEMNLSAERQRAIEYADQICELARELFRINDDAIERYRAQRDIITNKILWGRFTILMFGPVMGLFLGWRSARRLDRTIARIAVTLHDADTKINSDIGTLSIHGTSNFEDVEQQAEQVAERMRQVSRELQSARREVLQAERLAAVGELAAGVAHEIRNPLTSVKLLLQYAIRKASGPTLDESQLRLILDEIGRMETTIQGLLDFARPPKLNIVKHDLRHTLHRALNLVDSRARQQGIEIVMGEMESPMIVEGDTEKLHQVLVNLLLNAVEAMPDGGRLSIHAEDFMMGIDIPRRPTTEMLSHTQEQPINHVAVLTIQDTGKGIDSHVLTRLFEPFATTKERGTGLGLAVSHRIIEEHRGTILACNVPEGGAQFTVTIPLVESILEVTAEMVMADSNFEAQNGIAFSN
jgi:two-component system, NtrC family, sensor histidine kinase HydH